MNMRLYGICFKMRGGPALLDHVQADSPVPVEMMQEVMEQIGTITPEEMAFAERLDTDWKKAFNERVPLSMSIGEDGGYDITCSVPDELLDTISLLTGRDGGKLVEEYAADHLKNVCGIEAEVVSVDVSRSEDPAPLQRPQASAIDAPRSGFSMDDLSEEPDDPAFDDVAAFPDMEVGGDVPDELFAGPQAPEVQTEEPVQEIEDDVSGFSPEDLLEGDDEGIPLDGPDTEDAGYGDDGSYVEDEGYGSDEDEGYEDYIPDDGPEPETELEPEPEPEPERDPKAEMDEALSGIYRELVSNITDKKLDERLGLKIAQ